MPGTVAVVSLEELERTFGVLFVGYILAMVGYGFTFFQTYVYYSRFPNDHWGVKSMVAVVCALDTITSALASQALYFYLIDLFPLTTLLVDATKTLCAENGLAVLVVYIVQIFYAFRVWTITKNEALTGAIVTVSTASLNLGIVMTVQMFNNRAFAHLAVTPVKAVVSTAQALTFASGLLTFAALCVSLEPSRNPGVKPMEDWFDKLVAYTFSRGAAATLVQFGYFISFITTPSQQIWIPFHLLASKFFVNSLLTMLNCREVFRGHGVNEEESVSTQGQSGNTVHPSSVARTNSAVRFNIVQTKPVLNVGVTSTVDTEQERNKIPYEYDINPLTDNSVVNKRGPRDF
jgi:hypothetical protein